VGLPELAGSKTPRDRISHGSKHIMIITRRHALCAFSKYMYVKTKFSLNIWEKIKENFIKRIIKIPASKYALGFQMIQLNTASNNCHICTLL